MCQTVTDNTNPEHLLNDCVTSFIITRERIAVGDCDLFTKSIVCT